MRGRRTVPKSVTLRLDDHNLVQFLPIALGFGSSSFGYVVTPNVDHVIRFYDNASFRELYARAQSLVSDTFHSNINWLASLGIFKSSSMSENS
jgi:UDP-N-acetyl-D-mannosaminuronic acid transferase (WecB/TagA/CpsF family)